jgi:uncharacterized membrane protein YqaE (UPF0057 family)
MSLFSLPKLSSTSKTVALASVLSFGTQVVFALLMLRWFTPQEVGEFSVISQIAFFWMTLALAQAPLTLLANVQQSPHAAARVAWRDALIQGVFLSPFVVLALWLGHINFLPAFAWIFGIAFFQMTWMLSQSFVLRIGSTYEQVLVRTLPPMVATFAITLGVGLSWEGPTLLASALLGYAVGAWGLSTAWRSWPHGKTASEIELTAAIHQADNRSSRLRFLHTFVDALLATAIVIVWQRSYGTEETGWLSALLRVLGFIPAIIHMAWAQVNLSRNIDQANQNHEWRLGLWGCLAVLCLVAFGYLAIHQSWLSHHWVGTLNYVWPVAVWQSAACLSAAFSHRPFQTNSETQFSWACIGVAAVQALALLIPLAFPDRWNASAHIHLFAFISASGLLSLSLWMSSLKSNR